VKFSEALASRKPIPRLGDIRLRFDTDMLVGERVPRPGWGRYTAELALVIALGFGAVCVLVALAPEAPTGASIPLGILSGLCGLAGLRLEIAKRSRRGFLLHFANRTLRIERPSRWTGQTSTLLVPFAEIREAGVTQDRDGRYALEVELAPGSKNAPARVEVLIPSVAPTELEDLFRVADLTRAAVGLEPPPPSGDPGSSFVPPRK
jgi:hypothetical protein